MTMKDVAGAMLRAEAALQRRPEMGLHEDSTATAHWQPGGTQVLARHANGHQVATDMPPELGGNGLGVTPGWLFRAALASCSTTVIAMTAAAQGIELATLEVRASSRSDTRGVLGICGSDGQPVCASPTDLQLDVRIAAPGVTAERLQALVDQALQRSPVPAVLPRALPLVVKVAVLEAAPAS